MKPLSLAHLPPDAPAWLFALILGGLILHIGAGSIGIIAGYVAILAPKGKRLHRFAGRLFVLTMMIMGAAATLLAVRIHQRGNVAGGLLAFYLVGTAWMAVRRAPRSTGRFEVGALLFVLGVVGTMATFGVEARMSPAHRLDGYPAPLYFTVAAIALFFAWGDLRMIRSGGLSGTRRLARHAGRMGFGLFLAAGSFFIGQQKVMPAALHGSPVLLVLGLAPLGLTIFWLVRIRRPKTGSRRPVRGEDGMMPIPAERV
jgi:uncharacterized membrane protein